MMQTFSTVLFSAVLAVVTVAPNVTAVEAKPSSAAFCSRIEAYSTASNDAFTKKSKALAESRSSSDTKRTEQRASVDGKISATRTNTDLKRDEALSTLAKKAKNDAQKDAVATYVSTVKTAIYARRDANDVARMQFREDIDLLVKANREKVDADMKRLSDLMITYAASAKLDCQGSGTVDVASYKRALASTKANFVIQRADDAKLGEQIKALAATRNAEIKANNERAKTTIELARAALKVVFAE